MENIWFPFISNRFRFKLYLRPIHFNFCYLNTPNLEGLKLGYSYNLQ